MKQIKIKMIIKLLIVGVLGITVIQAFPTEPVKVTLSPEQKEIACDKKLTWYRETTSRVQEMFDKYYGDYKGFKKANNPNASHIDAEHTDFEHKVTEALDRFQEDVKKIYNISDDSARMAFCIKEINWFKVLDQNLTKTATNMKKDVLNILDAMGVPEKVKEDFDKVLSRIVNFLFIIDMTKNLFKDVKSLLSQAFTKTENGEALERTHEFNGDGELVETAQDVEYHDILEDTEQDRKLENEVKDFGNDNKLQVEREHAAERAVERENEHAAEREAEINGEEVNGEFEEPIDFEFRPVVIPV